MTFVRRSINLALPLGLIMASSFTPTLVHASPNQPLAGEQNPLTLRLLPGQVFTQPPGTNPMNPFGTPLPGQPGYIYKGGPTSPDIFPSTTNPFGTPFTFPSGQYSLGVLGNFGPQGMVVQQVVPGSPASRAGIVSSDLIFKMDGVTVTSQPIFNQVLSASGGVVQMVVMNKKGQFRQLVVPLQSTGARIVAPYMLGVRGIHGALGMTLNKIYPGTPAAQAGLKVGDQIVSMNNVAVANDAQFLQTVYGSSGRLYLQVRRLGKMNFVKVRLQLFRFGTLGTYSPVGATLDIVSPGTPASIAGFSPGDLIEQIDGRNVNSQASFETGINLSQGSSLMTVRTAFGGFGLVPVELLNNSLWCWCEPALGGMRLLNSPRGGLANNIGLVKGDIITQINNTPTPNLDALQNALENARGNMAVTYTAVVSGQSGTINVNIGNFFN